MRHLIVTILLFFSLFFLSCMHYKQELHKLYVEKGNAHYVNLEYSQALDAYVKAAKLSRSIDIQIRIIEINMRLKKYDDARSLLDTTLKRDPGNTILLELDAYWYLLLERNKEAILRYEDLLRDNAFQPRILANLGVLYGRTGELWKAYDYFKKAIEISDISEVLVKNYHRVLLALEEQEEGSADIQEQIQQDIHFVVERTRKSYLEGTITVVETKRIASQLLSAQFTHAGFSLYASMVEDRATQQGTRSTAPRRRESAEENGNEKELVEVYFILSEILFNRDYDITVSNRFLRGLDYLEQALEGKYGATEQEHDKLIALLVQTPTEVLFNRVRNLYGNYAIPVPEETSRRLEE